MRPHPFEPGKLIAGLLFLGLAGLYALDAAGELDVPAFAPLLALPAGLTLAGLATWLTYVGRRRRARRRTG
ncbi:hypothetical protein [Streptomyces sp. SAJ15]|uniref:hypothetical protein n=1 Tax=Streptomyces sp. SAJ15 TaxID=2011095 RepID=UPI001185A641|nr:hypothetical protein [Streptomyces sp. SAJ15]TVL90091.1 hypothetical protein CD790_23395 [Streptomyces sp. SAJ15]